MLQRYFRIGMNTGYSVTPVIHVNQYDHDEQWIFTLVDETGAVYTPSTGGIVGLKSDGNVIVNAGTVNSSGQVVINETQQMTAAAGDATYELLLDNSTHGSANFIVRVEPKPGDNASMSASDLSLLQEAIDSTNPEHIADSVQDWMDDNLAPSQWVIDNTLSIAGAAADAKKVGDVTSELKTALNGTVLPVYGEAQNITGATTSGLAYINTTGRSSTNYQYAHATVQYIPVTANARYFYTGEVYNSVGGVCFYDINHNFISAPFTTSAHLINEPVPVPQNAAYMNASTRNGNNYPLALTMQELVTPAQLDVLTAEVNNINAELSVTVIPQYGTVEDVTGTPLTGTAYNNTTGNVTTSFQYAQATAQFIPIVQYAKYYFTGEVYNFVGGVCFYDSEKNFISAPFTTSATYINEPLVIPSNAVYLNASTRNGNNYPLVLTMQEGTETTLNRLETAVSSIGVMNHLYVSPSGSDTTGDGSVANPYATIYHANESITDNSENNKYTIHVADGTYTDLQTMFAGTDTGGVTQGINCKDYVYYEGNINNPSACKIVWDGAYGYTPPFYYEGCGVDKCIFHIKARHTGIKGFCLESSNTRYCLHIESSGNGRITEWEVSDCIFIWHGQPDCADRTTSTSCIGTGSGNFEKGHLVRCKIVNDSGVDGGFSNHDSVNRYANVGVREGAEIKIESCVFNGGGSATNVRFRNINGDNNIDGYDRFSVINCIGINRLYYALEGGSTVCKWRAEIKCSDIIDNVFATENLLQ